MAERITCQICQGGIEPDSPVVHRCEKCGTPYHYVCWVYNDRRCAIYGCERPDLEEEEREVLRESHGWFGDAPMRIVVVILAGVLCLFFLLMAMEACEHAPY
ncbi:MAG: hypothetical protein ACYTAF_03480 [Planctomycetota bacterium]